MNYIIDFSLIAIAYLSITAFFYRRQPKVPSVRNTMFGCLLYLGVFFAVMDVVVVVIEPFSSKLPMWVCYGANAVFLLSIQLSCVLFFMYVLVLIGFVKGAPRRVILLSSIPFFITALLIFLPIGSGGIFYMDEAHIYHRGSMYVILYLDTALYLLASLVAVLIRRQQLLARKLLCICFFLTALFISMLIQYSRPQLLLNAMANALALTLIYHVLEAPSTNVDTLTGVLNRAAFPLVVQDSYEQDHRCTLFIIPIGSLGLVNRTLGMAMGDRLLTEFAACLRSSFSDSYVFRLAGDVFAVLTTGGQRCDNAKLESICAVLPDSLTLGQSEVMPESGIACVNSEDADSPQLMLALTEYILLLTREQRLKPVLLADADFLRQFNAAELLERKLNDAISMGRIEVFYQPLHDTGGRLCALEALVRIQDGEGGWLPTQEAVELSERNGGIYRLSELILRRVCAFIRDNEPVLSGLHHIGVNLSALQFLRDDLCEQVSAITDEYGVSRSLLSFEITETAAATVADVSRNMRRMNEAGFSFLLDDFGKGYANFNNIARLPLLCVKIDKSILWEAPQSRERMALLRGVVEMLHTLELVSVCEGVETEEQAGLLGELGVDMLQGYLFSKPLPPAALLSYIDSRCGNEL